MCNGAEGLLFFSLFYLFTFSSFPRPLYGKLASSLWKTVILSMKYWVYS